FFGGVAIFGCAYFAYAMLRSPEKPQHSLNVVPTARPKNGPTSASSAALLAAPSASSSAAAGPPQAPEGMAYVAPATFKMGEGKTARDVTLTRGYFLDREEVTVRQYAACVSKRMCTAASRVTLAPATAPDDREGDDRGTDSPADPPAQTAAGSSEFVET